MTSSEDAEPASPAAAGATLWHGRFAAGPAEELLAYTASLPFDRRLWPQDIRGSQAHVRGLGRAGLLDEADVAAVLGALEQVAAELSAGTFAFAPTDEDVHTAIERRVTELAGPAGARLHTGRSRNDQVATDLRLWCKDELPVVAARIVALQQVLLERARAAGGAYLPGYTHLQRAQPVLLAHHLLAHGWALGRDVDRLLATVARLDVSPLGAGALAGSSLPLDPAATAADLGFAGVFANSLDAVSDRDFVAEALFDLTLVAIHLSRMGEEWVLWTSDELGFARLDDGYATGSSMMPQKKNPDIAELARGKAGRVIGDLTGLLVVLKGLPLAYNRDLQEDKEPLFDAVDQVRAGPRRADGNDCNGNVRARTDAGRGRRAGARRHRPGRVAGRPGDAVPGRPCGRRHGRAPVAGRRGRPGGAGRRPPRPRSRRRRPRRPGDGGQPPHHTGRRWPGPGCGAAGAVRHRAGRAPHTPRRLSTRRRAAGRTTHRGPPRPRIRQPRLTSTDSMSIRHGPPGRTAPTTRHS